MLATWSFTAAHFVGHSFGSIVVAWMVLLQPACVSYATFIDPVCFLLAKYDVGMQQHSPTHRDVHRDIHREVGMLNALIVVVSLVLGQRTIQFIASLKPPRRC